MNCVLIKMGGQGVRFGSSVPKQFYEINGEPLFAYVLRKYARIKVIDAFIIVTNAEWISLTEDYANEILKNKLIGIVCGGDSNVKSAYNGIKFACGYLKGDDILLVHDVTDPIINEKAVCSAVETAIKYGSCVVGTEQVHTLYTKNTKGYVTGTIKKKSVSSGYSPEAFKMSLLWDCFKLVTENELNNMTSVTELVLSRGIKPMVVLSHQLDLKITYKEDMNILTQMIQNSEKLYTAN